MATYDASVKKALTSAQQDLIDHKEHCSADSVKLATVGRERGHQVRIKRNESEYGRAGHPAMSDCARRNPRRATRASGLRIRPVEEVNVPA
jgi:hypothetical protein